MPDSTATSGDWTADGFVVVNNLHVSRQRLIIKAGRLFVVSVGKELQLHAAGYTPPGLHAEKPVRLEVEVDMSTRSPTASQVDAVLSKIFLGTHDDLPDLLPEYWKPCVRAGLVGKDPCRFSSEILAVPGVGPAKGSLVSETTDTSAGGATEPKVYRVGSGVSPPRPTYSPEPEFSERARRAKFQGVVTLGVVVNAEGLPTNIHILSPLGCGLDAKAVQAVERWRFSPAVKDGQPVPAEIQVEVSFHLY